jgi:hypothetical protein
MEVAGANRRWRLQFRYRGSRRESAVAQLFSLGHIRMTSQKKMRLVLLPVQIYGALALFAQAAYRAAYGHEASSAFVMFAMWSCIAAGFLAMIGAVVQEHFRFRGDAGLNVVLGLFFIFASAELAPFIAR